MKYQVRFRAKMISSRENDIFTRENKFSHVKRLPLLWLHNKSHLSKEKKLFKRNGLVIH